MTEPTEDVIRKMVTHYARLTHLERDDLAQECWLRMLRYPGPAHLVSRDACIISFRRALWWRARDQLGARPMRYEGPSDDRLDVPTLLAMLSPRERQVIELFYWRGLSIKEIGHECGIGWTTAAVTKNNALVRLRRAYVSNDRA